MSRSRVSRARGRGVASTAALAAMAALVLPASASLAPATTAFAASTAVANGVKGGSGFWLPPGRASSWIGAYTVNGATAICGDPDGAPPNTTTYGAVRSTSQWVHNGLKRSEHDTARVARIMHEYMHKTKDRVWAAAIDAATYAILAKGSYAVGARTSTPASTRTATGRRSARSSSVSSTSPTSTRVPHRSGRPRALPWSGWEAR